MGSLTNRSFPHKADRNTIKEMKCMALGACGLAEGTNASTLKTTVAVDICVNGVVYTKPITNNIAMSSCTQQGVSTFAKYLVSSASKTRVDPNTGVPYITVTKGVSAPSSDGAILPDLPWDSAPIGYFEVETDETHTFTSGTSDLSDTGITVTFHDLVVMPDGM